MGHSLTGSKTQDESCPIQRVVNNVLGRLILTVQAGPVLSNVQFSVVQDLSPFNVILGCTWLHYMKVIPTYHQMVDKDPPGSRPLAKQSKSRKRNSPYEYQFPLAPEKPRKCRAPSDKTMTSSHGHILI
ncbi:hypothetical protein CK203_018591 [Vitis vinifera]|uniref:Uncharacterized protein n=1 Tax=Vitis vinifera TaxID=29760 RepID=A0A438J6B2_VITVI|nr:hypothetical protein CK203_018591 [Vitis vinifera]